MLGSTPKDAIDHDFSRWFHLERYEAPRLLADGATWHGFRPEGARFRDLVTINLEADGAERITEVKLCLDRAFIEHPKDGAFARDVTVSFLHWATPDGEQDELRSFLRELGDLGPNVIRLARTPQPEPIGERTPLYRTYLGEQKEAELALAAARLKLTNLQARDGPRDPQHDWIWIRLSRISAI